MVLHTPETCRGWRNALRISCASSWFFSWHDYVEIQVNKTKNTELLHCVLLHCYYLAIPYTYRLFVVATSYIQLSVLHRQLNLYFIVNHTFTVPPKAYSISRFLSSEICLINITFRDLTILPFWTFHTVHIQINVVKCCLINTRGNTLNSYSPSVHRSEYEWNGDFRVSFTQ
jgi:hypothetical protein